MNCRPSLSQLFVKRTDYFSIHGESLPLASNPSVERANGDLDSSLISFEAGISACAKTRTRPGPAWCAFRVGFRFTDGTTQGSVSAGRNRHADGSHRTCRDGRCPLPAPVRSTAGANGRDVVVGDVHDCVRTSARAVPEPKSGPVRDRLASRGDLVGPSPHSLDQRHRHRHPAAAGFPNEASNCARQPQRRSCRAAKGRAPAAPASPPPDAADCAGLVRSQAAGRNGVFLSNATGRESLGIRGSRTFQCLDPRPKPGWRPGC